MSNNYLAVFKTTIFCLLAGNLTSCGYNTHTDSKVSGKTCYITPFYENEFGRCAYDKKKILSKDNCQNDPAYIECKKNSAGCSTENLPWCKSANSEVVTPCVDTWDLTCSIVTLTGDFKEKINEIYK